MPAPDYFRMSGAKLRWAATKGPKLNRPAAQAELDRRAAKRDTTPAQAPASSPAPAVGITRMGEDFFAGVRLTPAMWASLAEGVKSNA